MTVDPRRLAEALRSVASSLKDAAYELDMVAQEIFATNPRPGRDDDALMATPIAELELSVRSTNCLRNVGVETVDQLAAMKRSEFGHIKHFGRRSQNEVMEVMANLGIGLREE
jgi:DNA-directed RNA polymerase alpha subunit